MRPLFHLIDALLRKIYGIYNFCDDKDCLLRIQRTQAPRVISLPGGVVEKYKPVLAIHLWNERVPSIPPGGPDLVWARKARQMFVHSLRAVAREMENDPNLAGVCAVGGVTMLFSPSEDSGGKSMMHRLGFNLVPYDSKLGRFGEFWENLYSWLLIWTYNPPSLRYHQITRLRRTEIWMLTAEFLQRFGDSPITKEDETQPDRPTEKS